MTEVQVGLALEEKGEVDMAVDNDTEALTLVESVAESNTSAPGVQDADTPGVADTVSVDEKESENNVDGTPMLVEDCTTGATVPWLVVNDDETAL